MRRVLVIGCSGSGKSTFSNELARITGLPLVSLDAEFWQPGWKPTPSAVWRTRVSRLSEAEAWILDGNYDGTLDIRLARADTLIWFRIPRWRCLTRVYRRVATSYGRVRADMAAGCPEQLPDREFLTYIWNFERVTAPRIENRIATYGQHLTPVIFRHDADSAQYLMSIGHSDDDRAC